MIKKFGVTDALISLVPGAQWAMEEEDYERLIWLDETYEKPELADLEAEIVRLQSEYDALEYQRLRAPEYPDFREYLDGIVKGDQAQIDAYIAACQAVKEKYPKPE